MCQKDQVQSLSAALHSSVTSALTAQLCGQDALKGRADVVLPPHILHHLSSSLLPSRPSW